MKKCNHCNQLLEDDAKFCPVCGNKIEESNLENEENNQTITTEKIDPNGFSFANNQFNFKTSSGLYTVKFSGNKFETPNLIR